MKAKSPTVVNPAIAARRLRHLLFGQGVRAAKRLRHLPSDQNIGIVMATKAMHMLGDISRRPASAAVFHAEDRNHYIGRWLEGFGLMNVRFPKRDCRLLTEAEVRELKKGYMTVGPFPS